MALPGSRLLAFASRWFDATTVARVFEPLVADWQREWRDAPPGRQAWVRVRGGCGFAIAAITVAPSVLLLTQLPAATTRRVLARVIIFTATLSALLTVPFVVDFRHMPAERQLLLVLLLLPSGAALVFPFAMTWVTDALRRSAHATAYERIAAVRVAFAASIFAFVLMGWIVPLSNQQFRELAAPAWARPPARGVRELTTAELFFSPGGAMAEPQKDRAAAIDREIHQRAVLTLLPAVLVWLRFSVLCKPRRGRFSPLPPAIATVATIAVFFPLYSLSAKIAPLVGMTTGMVLWLPIIVLSGWAYLETHRSQAERLRI